MKRLLGLWATIVVFGLLPGCSDSVQNGITGPETIAVAAREGDGDPPPSDPICESGASVSLVARNNRDTGTVTMATDGTTLLVQITTTDPWTLAKSQVAVGGSLEEIPNRRGRATPRRFEHSVVHDSGAVTYQYTIDLSSHEFVLGDEVYVAVHATVEKVNRRGRVRRKGAWAAGDPFPRGRRATYVHFTLGDCTDDGGDDGEGGGDTGE